MIRLNLEILIWITASIFSSCSSTSQNNGITIDLKPTDIVEEMYDSFTQPSWVQLSDNNTDELISNPSKILRTNDNYFILDKSSDPNIKVFDSTGAYLYSIGSIGNGPGQYPCIMDFALNSNRNEVVILANSSTAYVYDIYGNFLHSKKLDDAILQSIAHTDCGYIATTDYASTIAGDDSYLLYTFNEDLIFKSKSIITDKYLSPIPFPSGKLQSLGHKAIFLDVLNSKLIQYNCDNNQFEVLMTFNLPNPMPIKFRANINSFFENQLKYDWIMDIIADDELIEIIYIAAGNPYCMTLDYKGNILNHYLCNGLILNAFNLGNRDFAIPLSPELFFNLTETKNDAYDLSFDSKNDGNLILMLSKFK